MAKDIDKIAARLGGKVVCRVPDVGGGAFGMARLAGIMAVLQTRLQPGQGGPPKTDEETDLEQPPRSALS